MTEAIGAVKLGSTSVEPFLGRELSHQKDYSENLASVVDGEIRKLIERAHQEAFDILVDNRATLDKLVIELLDKETLNKEEIAEIFAAVKPVAKRPAWTGSATRRPSNQPPVAIPTESTPKKRAPRKTKDKSE